MSKGNLVCNSIEMLVKVQIKRGNCPNIEIIN